ncbi:hypothetical protein FOH10_00990 [Nocardia otitidiscaviarum]|uniref:Uncharacterized protein n=2 Tax=Nocardia otitidiscaviarum TaxID=1823 RepID=A0A516NF41_9NOCA|nr:hypothetical protein [Nocardia otitidiscaviarum]MCP9622833.1 hypothetical protein [Nocardia otitidiscaviarum]QDP77528.1 hypothetical protein FOH10_00990 [Nocardia otitidiscaviarum]
MNRGPVTEEFAMTFIARRTPATLTTALLGGCRRGAHRLWTRRNLTPQERANLLAGYTPPAVVSASLGCHPKR